MLPVICNCGADQQLSVEHWTTVGGGRLPTFWSIPVHLSTCPLNRSGVYVKHCATCQCEHTKES